MQKVFFLRIMNILCITPIKHLHGVYENLCSFGDVLYLPSATKGDLLNIDFCKFDVIFCNPNKQTFVLDQSILENYNGKIITASTGLNHIDFEYCNRKNIEVLSLKTDYDLINSLPSTSELAFGLMLSLLRNMVDSQLHVKNYNWDYTNFVGRQIKDLNIGIVGYGRLGKMMNSFCEAFNANTFICDPYIPAGPKTLSLKDMFHKCDVISLHVHVTNETKYMINRSLFTGATKKPYIINTSRGEIVNEEDIVYALKNNVISGYGADVVEHEFSDLTKSPIIRAMNEGQNIIITPHIGGMTLEGQTKAYNWAVNKLSDLQ